MIYTLKDNCSSQTFEGIQMVTMPTKGLHLAIVFINNGEDTDYWYLDPNCPFALDELKRFYRMEGVNESTHIQVWKDSEPSEDLST